jgi:hypothetical protein
MLMIVPGIRGWRRESIRIRRALRGLLIPMDIIVVAPKQIRRLGNTGGLVYDSA